MENLMTSFSSQTEIYYQFVFLISVLLLTLLWAVNEVSVAWRRNEF